MQHIRIGDLSIHSSTTTLGTDDSMMNVDEDEYHLPSGVEPEDGSTPMLSRSEERTLARESTSAFAGKRFAISADYSDDNSRRLGHLILQAYICFV